MDWRLQTIFSGDDLRQTPKWTGILNLCRLGEVRVTESLKMEKSTRLIISPEWRASAWRGPCLNRISHKPLIGACLICASLDWEIPTSEWLLKFWGNRSPPQKGQNGNSGQQIVAQQFRRRYISPGHLTSAPITLISFTPSTLTLHTFFYT
jgi:hypothetical protein